MVHCESAAQWRWHEGVGATVLTVCGKWRFGSIRRSERRNAFGESVFFRGGGSRFMVGNVGGPTPDVRLSRLNREEAEKVPNWKFMI